MKNIITIIWVGLILASCKDKELTKIENVFYEFNEANIATDGKTIYNLTDTESHQYYSSLLDMVINFDSLEISKLGIIDKINILSSRAILDDSLLLAIDAKEYMEIMYSDVNTMDDEKKKIIKDMKVKNIKISQNSATGELAPGGRSLPNKVHLIFSLENGEWKYNLIPMLKFTETNLNTMLNENGITESEFIELILSEPSLPKKFIKTPQETWNPIKAKAPKA